MDRQTGPNLICLLNFFEVGGIIMTKPNELLKYITLGIVVGSPGGQRTLTVAQLIKRFYSVIQAASEENLSLGLPTRSDTNWAVQTKYMDRGLKFWI